MKVYQPLESKDSKTGLFYRTWEVPEGMPVESSLILVAPPEGLQFPKYNSNLGIWQEDKDSIIESLKAGIDALQAQDDGMQSTLLDVIEMISTLGATE